MKHFVKFLSLWNDNSLFLKEVKVNLGQMNFSQMVGNFLNFMLLFEITIMKTFNSFPLKLLILLIHTITLTTLYLNPSEIHPSKNTNAFEKVEKS